MGLESKISDDSRLLNPVLSADVFVGVWREVSEAPREMGLYIVDLGHRRVVAAYYVPSVGWSLDHSEMIGLEHSIVRWMEMPEGG